VYKRPHYHSTAHEALVILEGWAKLLIGGKKIGKEIDVLEGDVIIIPAGVMHQSLERGGFSPLLVAGMYPFNQKYDMCGPNRKDFAKARKNIFNVWTPMTDPIFGPSGILPELWK
jgi:uncharacterized protein YjlB